MAWRQRVSSLVWNRWTAAGAAFLTLAFAVGGFVFFFYYYPVLRAGRMQPVPFSHRIHAQVKQIDCRFCHYAVSRTQFAGIPSANKCLYCHNYIIPTHPQILKVASYAARNEPVPWRKITWLPDFVYFSHQRHIRKGVDCTECHGDVARMDRIVEPREYRKKMGFCMDCHFQRAPNSVDCWNCHK
jgi:hypothetical protein